MAKCGNWHLLTFLVATYTDTATLEVILGSVVPEGFESYSAELFSENIEYLWGVQKDDGAFRYLNNDDVASGLITGELGKPTLTVNSPGNDGYTFYCIIRNTLNGISTECSRDEALAFYVV